MSLRGQIRGGVVWECSECGLVNQADRLGTTRQVAQCSNPNCQTRVLFGLRVLTMGRGHKRQITPDWLVWMDRELERDWGKRHETGEPANVVVAVADL